uniref:Uncharacterized protein n=1 Tax=Myoviridae sp. ctByu2 TaxID=2827668 RepID=A0A8S5SAC6_9CAUD|nr:MAG TPA: hypothetical protein [Myoviridae sp. ctByu2]
MSGHNFVSCIYNYFKLNYKYTKFLDDLKILLEIHTKQ